MPVRHYCIYNIPNTGAVLDLWIYVDQSVLEHECRNGPVPRLTLTQIVNKQPRSLSSTGQIN